ncbi:MAG: PKD domain-containing protein [Chloroflexi bacterium]|nr:PKD domain-containing protein [Chloroflexota bacterium]
MCQILITAHETFWYPHTCRLPHYLPQEGYSMERLSRRNGFCLILAVLALLALGAFQTLVAAPPVSTGCSTINTNPLYTDGYGQWRDFHHGTQLYYAGDTISINGVWSVCWGGCYVSFTVTHPNNTDETLSSGDGYAPGASYTVPVTGYYRFSVGGWSVQPMTSMTCTPSATPATEPTASYTASVLNQTVTFTDTSTGNPTSWAWDFGDGSTATVQHPTHTYAKSGSYTVCLTASNVVGNSTPACGQIQVSGTHQVVVTGAAPQPVEAAPPDERLNWHFGDLEAVVYRVQDDAGKLALHIYGVQGNSRGYLLLTLPASDLSAYQTNPPQENRLVAAEGRVSIYALTTPGQFQINIGPNEEGKTYVLVFDIQTLELVNRYLIEAAP